MNSWPKKRSPFDRFQKKKMSSFSRGQFKQCGKWRRDNVAHYCWKVEQQLEGTIRWKEYDRTRDNTVQFNSKTHSKPANFRSSFSHFLSSYNNIQFLSHNFQLIFPSFISNFQICYHVHFIVKKTMYLLSISDEVNLICHCWIIFIFIVITFN